MSRPRGGKPRVSRPSRALAARTAGTSTHHGPSVRSVTTGRVSGPKVISRSPSTASTPASARTGWATPGSSRTAPATSTGSTSPGAIGAVTRTAPPGPAPSACAAPAPTIAVTPNGSRRPTGDSWPRTLDSPIASGSANAQNSWVSVAGSHTARVATCRSADTATSTRAVSARPPASTRRTLARVSASARGTAPVATRPAARPATVASRITGNALLVPVDTGSSGTSPAAVAATRAVPSPPRQTTTRAPQETMRSTAVTVSAAVCVIGRPSRNSTSGQGARPARGSPPRRPRARNTPAEIPPASVDSSARCTPAAPNAASMRWIMLTFSAAGNTVACVTTRRMSLPDIGLATTPTIESPTQSACAAARPAERLPRGCIC